MKDKNNDTGNYNTGNYNTGDYNTGNYNTGDYNTGDCNTGDYNTGYGNTGNRNTGNGNAGYGNTGNRNTGDYNTGYGNSTNRSTGIFCTKEQEVYSFDKPSSKKFDEIDHPNFYEFYLTKWIPDYEMTDQEKKDNPTFHTCLGYLKTYTYEEAWANFWRDTDEDNRKKFLALPNFDADIFKEITGIDVDQKTICAGKIVEIDGKKYKLQEV